MKKIIFALLIALDLFAGSPTQCYSYPPYVYTNKGSTTSSVSGSCSSLVDNFYCVGGGWSENRDYSGVHATTGDNCAGILTVTSYQSTASCATGYTASSSGECIQIPTSCSWATNPPWYQTSNTVSTCIKSYQNPTNDLSQTSYLSDLTWCSSDTKCYAREFYCPKGQQYDNANSVCKDPSLPLYSSCREGFYKQNGSITGTSGKTCFTDFICKSDPKTRFRKEVSCGYGPVDPTPVTNPDPLPVEDIEKPPSTSMYATICHNEKIHATVFCFKPKVLSFECNPLTGEVTKNTCRDPNVPDEKPIESGDDTKGSTTADIKSLTNDLPRAIKDALSDYFTDGSMPHLEAIRGTLDATLLLDADRNDKLDSLSASADAGLVLQSDANDKLDSLSASANAGLVLQSDANGKLDGIQSSIDMVNTSLNSGGNYQGTSMPTESDLSPDTETTDGFDTFTNAFDQIQNQFTQAQSTFSGGVPNISFGSGSCPTYSFYGISISLSKIGDSIAPFSSVFSILIYISLMIGIFKLVFGFFSRGV